MEEKLKKLYRECINELKDIGIDIENPKMFGNIEIGLAKRNSKRYGCCKQSEPDVKCFHYVIRKRRKVKIYDKFNKHSIEVCKWVLDLDNKIIKNTIMHELIHCFPNCNNHGEEFKKYAKFINDKLGYDIKRLGNKEKDFKQSNLEYEEKSVRF